MSQAVICSSIDSDAYVAPEIATPRHKARPHVLLASLAGAFVTTCLSGASLVYAYTHIPEVDPDAQPAPAAAIAEIAAEAAASPDKLEVLTPPVYGSDLVSEAPAAPFVPLSAKVSADTVDLDTLEQSDGVTRACDDPCTAQAGYVAVDASDQAQPAPAAHTAAIADTTTDDNDDGNAPPPPDMVVN